MKNAILALLLFAAPCVVQAAEKKDDPVLDAYVKVATALAADDFDAAKKDAAALATVAEKAGNAELAKQAEAVAGNASIAEARESFKIVSKTVIPSAKDAAGYYVMTCPMTKNGEWVQDDPQVANPYYGAAMLTCGMIKKDE